MKVVTLYDTNFRDPAATLRVIADEIESGKHGAIWCCTVALMGNTLEVFGMGSDSEVPTMHFVLCAAAQKLQESLLDHK